MAVAIKGSPVGTPRGPQQQTQITAITKDADVLTRNFTKGAADMVALEIDNLIVGGTKNWVKLYDDVTTSWDPGVTKPVLILPVAVYAAASAGANRATGVQTLYCLEGFNFPDGASAAASQEDGDEAAVSPAEDAAGYEMNIEFIHRKPGSRTAGAPPGALTTGIQTLPVGGAKEDTRILIGGASATADNDINSGSAATLYRARINATNNPTEDVYLRLYDAAAPGVSDDSEVLLPARKGTDITWEIPRGVTFATALSIRVVTNKGASSGNTSPTGTVDVILDIA
jgi:hypothetical protein